MFKKRKTRIRKIFICGIMILYAVISHLPGVYAAKKDNKPQNQKISLKHALQAISTFDLSQQIESTQTERKKNVCEICKKRLSTAFSLKRHIKDVHEKKELPVQEESKKFACKGCNRFFSRNEDLKRHIEEVHEKKKPFKCGSCNKEFARREHLTNHASTHKGRFAWICFVCRAYFQFKYELVEHNKIGHSESTYGQCSLCNTQCADLNGLKVHIKDTHPNNCFEFECDTCLISFPLKKGYDQHMLGHECQIQSESDNLEILQNDSGNSEAEIAEEIISCPQSIPEADESPEQIPAVNNKKESLVCDKFQQCFSEQSDLDTHLFKHIPEAGKLIFAIKKLQGSLDNAKKDKNVSSGSTYLCIQLHMMARDFLDQSIMGGNTNLTLPIILGLFKELTSQTEGDAFDEMFIINQAFAELTHQDFTRLLNQTPDVLTDQEFEQLATHIFYILDSTKLYNIHTKTVQLLNYWLAHIDMQTGSGQGLLWEADKHLLILKPLLENIRQAIECSDSYLMLP